MSGKILIVDDLATNRIVLKVKLASAQYETLLADNGVEALRIARAEQPDLILMDVMMPEMNGLELCAAIKADPQTAHAKVIMITGADEYDNCLTALEVGADDFLCRPVDEVALLARVRSLLRMRDKERELHLREATFADLGLAEAQSQFEDTKSVMVIAASNVQSQHWAARLKEAAQAQIVAATPEDALRRTQSEQEVADLFVIDVDAGGRNQGLRLMSDLRSRASTRHSACMVILPQGDSERAAMALDLGANDISYDPFDAEEMSVRMRTQLERKRKAEQLRAKLDDRLRLAVIDPLTGLYNRRYGMRHLDMIAKRCEQQKIEAAVLLIDIDYFKAVNDTHGHGLGDRFLAAVAGRLRQGLRGEDTVTRIGGEEFMAVLPGTSLADAQAVAERLRSDVAALQIEAPDGTSVSITLSIGVGMMTPEAFDTQATLQGVDRALYDAKAGGRNLVVIAA